MAKSDSARPGIRPERNIPGLMAASMACEGPAQWEESERWARQLSESHPADYAWYWYFWCGRTGRGASRRLASWSTIASCPPEAGPVNTREVGVYHLSGNRQLGLLAFRRAWTLEPTYRHALIVAQLARILAMRHCETKCSRPCGGSRLSRPANRRRRTKRPMPRGWPSCSCCKPEMGPWHDCGRSINSCAPRLRPRGEFAHIVGQELQAIGRTGEAELYWRRTGQSRRGVHYSTLAGWELAKRHITSRDEQEELPAGGRAGRKRKMQRRSDVLTETGCLSVRRRRMIRSAASADRSNAVVFTAMTACLGCAAGVLVQQPTAPGDAPVFIYTRRILPYARGARTICPTGSAVKSCGKHADRRPGRNGTGHARDETLQEAEPQPAQLMHLLARERAKLTGK